MTTIRMCRGCGHIPIVKEVERVLQKENGILCGSVGCSVSIVSDMEKVDAVSSAHGRALAVATGIRRVLGDEKIIITYQGDGDCLNIGIGEFVHTCLRNEKLICVIINNQQFGMTGHQLSACTPLGVKTKTSVKGREEEYHGIPINVEKLVKALNPKVKYYITTSASREGIDLFKKQLEEALHNDGFSVIQIISPCPTFHGNVKTSYEFSKKLYEELK